MQLNKLPLHLLTSVFLGLMACSTGPILNQPAKTDSVSGFVCPQQAVSMRIQRDFKTGATEAVLQLPECEKITAVKIEVTGPEFTQPIYAVGADELGLVQSQQTCPLRFQLADVPEGNGRILSFQAFNADQLPLTQYNTQAVFNLSSDDLSIDLNCTSTATARVFQQILQTDADKALSTHLDLAELQSFIQQVSGFDPENGRFTVNPTFLNVSQMAADIVAASGNFESLNPQKAEYIVEQGIVEVPIQGLVAHDRVTLRLNDAENSVLEARGNGVWVFPALPVGDYELSLEMAQSGANYSFTNTVPFTLEAQSFKRLDPIIFEPAQPQFTLTETDLKVGEILQLTGQNFHAELEGNQVYFNDTPAELVSKTDDQLSVLVPRVPGEARAVTVKVGTRSSNVQLANVSRLKWEREFPPVLNTTPAFTADGTQFWGTETGSVLALDGASGNTLWTHSDPAAGGIYGAVVLSADKVLFMHANGLVKALNFDGELLWQQQLDPGSYGSLALDADRGQVYALTGQNRLVALNLVDGTQDWEYQGRAVQDTPFRTASSPVINTAGQIFISSADGYVYAFTPDGALSWEKELGSRFYSSPLLANGQLYVAQFNGYISALNTVSGETLWQYNSFANIMASGVHGPDGKLYWGSWAGRIHQLDGSGAYLGAFQAEGPVDGSAVLDHEGRLYYVNLAGKFFAMNPTTRQLEWSYQLENDASVNMAMDSQGVVYLASKNPNKLLALYSDSGALADSDWPQSRANMANTAHLKERRDTAPDDHETQE